VRPIYALLAAFVGGILLSGVVPPLPAPFALGAAGLLAIAYGLIARRPGPVPAALLLTAVLLLGLLRAQIATTVASDDISHRAGGPSVWVLGEIDSTVITFPVRSGSPTRPRRTAAKNEPVADRNGGDGLSFTVRVRGVNDYSATTAAASGLLRVSVFGVPAAGSGAIPGEAPRAGERLWLRGRVALPPTATNPGEFDDRAYLARQGIHATLTVKRAATDLRRVTGRAAGPSPSIASLATALHEHMDSVTRAHLSGPDADLLLGMLAGEREHSIAADRSVVPADTEDAFARTGTLHLLATSSLHVAVVALLVGGLLRLLTVPRKAAAALTMAAMWLFTLTAAGSGGDVIGVRSAVLRAALCVTIALLAPLVRRTAELRHTLAAAALVILALDPLALFDPGAQIAFAVVATIIGWAPVVERVIAPWEPAMSPVRRAARGLLLGLAGGLLAQIGALPLAASTFHQVSVVSPLANVLLAPLADALLVAGLLLTAIGPLGGPLWSVLAAGLHLLRGTAMALAAPDWAAFSVAAPPPAVVITYYALLGGVCALVRIRVLTPRRLFAPGAPTRFDRADAGAGPDTASGSSGGAPAAGTGDHSVATPAPGSGP
jgi:competence protein ComEC